MTPRKNPTSAPPEAAADAVPSFEQALERLETIVSELEGGELSLEESLARYEEGVRLSRRLGQKLDEAEKRIERLVEEPGEPPATRPFELDVKSAEEGGEGELPF
ncbi:MAG TPA: exodeoxyribonuclease VII small subunit [Candidatus Eisenbacteria bacterium]|jgi:exodeoxyribonuclease VII small subunit